MAPTPTVWIIVVIAVSILSYSHAATTASGIATQSEDENVSSATTEQEGVQTSSSKPNANMTPAQTSRAPKIIIADEVLPLVTFPATPSTNIIMDHNRYEVMKCMADGKPAPRFEWFRDGAKITSEGPLIKAFANGTLILKSFSSIENGYFQCKASNSLGTSVSDIVHVIAQVKPRESDDDGNKITPLPEKEPYSLHCDDLSPTVPPLEKRWYFGGDKNELTIDDRRGVDTDGTLHFAYTKMSTDSTVYTCGLVPETGTANSITLFPRGQLLIQQNRDSTLESTKPQKMFSKQEIKGIIRESLTLECFFASMPPAKITWKNSSHHVVTPGTNPRLIVDDFGRKLIVTQVRQEDEGTFSCTGENEFGSTEIIINVNVTSRPIVVPGGALRSRTVVDSEDYITLHCETTAAIAEALEPPKWYRNGIVLTQNNVPDPARYKFNSDLTKLRINDLNKQVDTACFQCNSSNSEGYEFFDASIRIINSIIITKQPADEIVIKYGESVDIGIQAKGDACCKINLLWTFNGTKIIPEKWQPFQADLQSNKLIFNSSLISEESMPSYMGVYICRVSNQHQSVDAVFAILLEGSRTEPVTVSSSSIGVWWIGLLCGVLAILVAVIIVIVLYKSNYPRSTYKLEEQEIKHNLNPEEDLLNQSFHEI